MRLSLKATVWCFAFLLAGFAATAAEPTMRQFTSEDGLAREAADGTYCLATPNSPATAVMTNAAETVIF